ncbi:MAG: cytochrome c biogenesis protein ResB [Verrucomicrobia bacterium]|nr:cytochrome c biogenesis protein ResB [Verrucomicrobiota bacterium]
MKNPSHSFTRWLFRFCGSIKLAMLLLTVLIVAIIVGTFIESRLDAAVAQSYVYDAPWFIAWLILLCVNLVGAVLVRYPWKKHQIGFVITHAGIVTILVGAIIGRIWGFEGSITLFKNQPPSDYLMTGRQILEVKSGDTTETHELNLSSKVPSNERPEKLKLGDLEVAAIDFAPELGLQTHVEKGTTGGAPALRLVMTSAMVGQPFDRWIMLDNKRHGQIAFGPAMISYQSGAPRSDVESDTAESNLVPSRELHFAFAKMPDMNIARPAAGAPTGIKSVYEFARDQTAADYRGKLELITDAGSFTFAVSEIIGREVPLEGTHWSVKFSNYFADLRMQGKQAVSVSEEPNNPAILFEILGPLVAENTTATDSVAAHGHAAHDHSAHDGHQCEEHSGKSGTSELKLYRAANGKLKFEARSRSNGSQQGEIKIGEEFTPGLADWICRVEEVTDHAVVRQELAPLSEDAPQRTGATGLLVRSRKGASTDTRWIRMGKITPVELGNETIEINFAHKLHNLPFTVQLEKFEVEMNEGTQNPGSYKSHVRFHDPKKEMTLTRAVWMNNPSNFPQFTGAGLLGTTYKFSQSSWNPDNLDETTLQVIRDPGWSLKWIGSLMLCGGLFTIFYLKPYPRFAKKAASVPRTTPVIPASKPQPENVLA